MEEMSVFFFKFDDTGHGLRQAGGCVSFWWFISHTWEFCSFFWADFGRVRPFFFSMLYRAGIFLGAGEVQWSGV